MRKPIILIGMMGCGKSTLGRMLAAKLGRAFVDLDAEIERKEGCSIPEIFARGGEETFRLCETEALKAAVNGENCVIATGGGIVTREENIVLMREKGMVVWLKRPLEEMIRDAAQENRPNLTGDKEERMRTLYAQRKALYEKTAHLRFENSGSAEVCAETLFECVVRREEETESRNGEKNRKIVLYVHGKGGNAQEAAHYQALFSEYEVYGLPYQGDTPWQTADELQTAYDALCSQSSSVVVIANSIGAYFAMNALHDKKIEKAFFISPILNMEKLIADMMVWAGVSEEMLREKGEIPTSFGETLSWRYLQYVRSHPIKWDVQTEILYAGHDALVPEETVTAFAHAHHAGVCVMENGEHWFHTDEQMGFLDRWLKRILNREETGMNQMIAYCGLDCEKCDAYLATIRDDQALREKTAKLWSELNGAEILPEQIRCEGCRANGVKTVYCADFCGIRQCALKKKVVTCGACSEKADCATLRQFTANNPDVLQNLKD